MLQGALPYTDPDHLHQFLTVLGHDVWHLDLTDFPRTIRPIRAYTNSESTVVNDLLGTRCHQHAHGST
ncbi:MAG: hypothetical protein ACI9E1_000173 [Cryomorphaceae bacterium]|jgi:hypothetical protein